MGVDKLHKSGVAHICRITPLTDQNDLIKATCAMEQLTRPSDLQDHYNSVLGPIIDTVDNLASTWGKHDIRLLKPMHTPRPAIASALKRLAQKGIRIKRNSASVHGLNQSIFPTVVGFPAELLLVIMIEKLTRFDYRPLLNVRVRNGVGDHHPD